MKHITAAELGSGEVGGLIEVQWQRPGSPLTTIRGRLQSVTHEADSDFVSIAVVLDPDGDPAEVELTLENPHVVTTL